MRGGSRFNIRICADAPRLDNYSAEGGAVDWGCSGWQAQVEQRAKTLIPSSLLCGLPPSYQHPCLDPLPALAAADYLNKHKSFAKTNNVRAIRPNRLNEQRFCSNAAELFERFVVGRRNNNMFGSFERDCNN